MNQTVATLKQPQSLGSKIDEMFALREEMRALNKELEELKEQYKQLEAEVLQEMDEQDLLQSKGRKATATVSETEVPTVTDWDALYDYITRTDQLFLLEKRVSSRIWRELKDSGEEVPGTEPFVRRSVNLRKVATKR